jgi:hypothetical protein
MVDDGESPKDGLKRLKTERKRSSDRHRKLVNQPNNMLASEQAEVEEIEKEMLITSIQLRLLNTPFLKWVLRLFRN